MQNDQLFYFACTYLSLLDRFWPGIIFRFVFPIPTLLQLLSFVYLWLQFLT